MRTTESVKTCYFWERYILIRKWKNTKDAHNLPQEVQRDMSIRDMPTIQCNATSHTLWHALNDVIHDILRQLDLFLFHCPNDGRLVCRRIWTSSNTSPKTSHIFSIELRSGERADHTIRWIPSISIQSWRSDRWCHHPWTESYSRQQYRKG